jgi:hypothetical protein
MRLCNRLEDRILIVVALEAGVEFIPENGGGGC